MLLLQKFCRGLSASSGYLLARLFIQAGTERAVEISAQSDGIRNLSSHTSSSLLQALLASRIGRQLGMGRRMPAAYMY